MRIRDEIISLIRQTKLASVSVAETSNLYTDLGLDSLAFVQLLLRIEDTFSISIDLMEMGTCLQVDRLIALVEKKVKEAGYDSKLAGQSEKPGKSRHN